jgi:hypothetical protein
VRATPPTRIFANGALNPGALDSQDGGLRGEEQIKGDAPELMAGMSGRANIPPPK